MSAEEPPIFKIPGATPYNPIVPFGGSTLVETMRDALGGDQTKDLPELFIAWGSQNQTLIKISKAESGDFYIEVMQANTSSNEAPINEDEARLWLERAVELNKRLEQIDTEFADTLEKYRQYLTERGKAYLKARQPLDK